MPIYCYECTAGHETEELILSAQDKEPTYCTHIVTKVQERTGRAETFECGLPLTKIIGGTSFQYKRGKNPNWPL